jgi:hypothetical protein
MLGITTFMFAFSGQQYRMVPVVQIGFWAVAALTCVCGVAALLITSRLRIAVWTMLAAVCAGWALAVLVEWRLSFVMGPEVSEYGGGAPEQQIRLAKLRDVPLQFGLVEWIPAGGPHDYAQVSYSLLGAPPDLLFRVRLRMYRADPMCTGTPEADIDGGSVRTDSSGRVDGARVAAPQLGRQSDIGMIWEFIPEGALDPAYRSSDCVFLRLLSAAHSQLQGAA